MMMFEVIKVLSPDGITTLRPRLATSSHMGDARATRTTSERFRGARSHVLVSVCVCVCVCVCVRVGGMD